MVIIEHQLVLIFHIYITVINSDILFYLTTYLDSSENI